MTREKNFQLWKKGKEKGKAKITLQNGVSKRSETRRKAFFGKRVQMGEEVNKERKPTGRVNEEV